MLRSELELKCKLFSEVKYHWTSWGQHNTTTDDSQLTHHHLVLALNGYDWLLHNLTACISCDITNPNPHLKRQSTGILLSQCVNIHDITKHHNNPFNSRLSRRKPGVPVTERKHSFIYPQLPMVIIHYLLTYFLNLYCSPQQLLYTAVRSDSLYSITSLRFLAYL